MVRWFFQLLLEYYRIWRFKHPNASDFIKVAQELSGIQLDWYHEYCRIQQRALTMALTVFLEENGVSKIRLRRVSEMPMPVDLELTFKGGEKELHYVPVDLMFGGKPPE